MSTTAEAVTAQVRQNMVNNCHWAVQHRSGFHYAEVRPIPIHDPKFGLPITTDCSGFATLMAKWSGAGDPNGNDFDGQGYTGTMLEHCEHIAARDTQPGDLVAFGAAPGEHVVVLVESAARGLSAMCVSHGQPGDPIEVTLQVEADAHRGAELTYLRLPAAGATPPDPHGNPFCPLAVDGGFGPQTIQAMQYALRVTTDGSFGTDTKKALQTHLRVTANGIIDAATVRALQAHVGVAQDGQWGPATTKGLQESLNADRF